MESPEKKVNIHISDKAATFINSRRLVNPVILVNAGFRSSGGEGCGGGCGGGGGCDEDQSGQNVAYLNAILVEGGKPGADFIKVDTAAGIPVYLARPVYEAARKCESTLIVTVKGLVMKKLSIEVLDLTALSNRGSSEQPNCH